MICIGVQINGCIKKEETVVDRRIKWLDISRGIGVLCVIISHDLFFPDTVNEFLDSFFMPLFFIGGGYL